MVTLTRRSFLGASGASLSALAVGTAVQHAHADPVEGHLARTAPTVIPGTASVPGTDGTLPDSAWAEAVTVADFTTFYDGLAVNDVAVDLLAGPSHLHLRIRIDSPAEARPGQIEVLFRSPTSRDVFRLRIPVRATSPGLTGQWADGIRNFTTVVPVITDNANAWSAEASIRYSFFGQAHGDDGEEWRLNVIGLHPVGSAPSWAWSPVRGARASDTKQSVVTVVAPVDLEDRLATVHLRCLPSELGEPWMPSEVGLTELEFGAMTVTLTAPGVISTASVAWAAPGTEWIDLADPIVSQNAGLVEVAITHPPMVAAGLYRIRVSGTIAGVVRTAIVVIDRETALRAVASHQTGFTGSLAPVTAGPSAHAEELRALVPDRVGMYFCGLPENPALRPERVFTFDPQTPEVLHAAASSLTYPHPDFPEDQSITVDVGETTVSYPYHEDGDGRRYFFSAHLWYLQRQHVLAALPALAETDPAGAARIIHEFALAYQTWVPTCDYLWLNYPVAPDSGPPYPSYGGMWARWSKSDLWDFRFLLPAFETVRRTAALAELSDQVGMDVEAHFVDQVLMPSVRFVDTFPTDHYNYANWLGLGLIGRSISDPDLVHRSVELVTQFYSGDFLFDGFHQLQTVSYHVQLINGTARVLEAVAGWSDPDGYQSPRTGVHFTDLDLGEQIPTVGLSEQIPRRLVYPNGRALPIQDTWPSDTPADPVTDSGSWLLPASGIVRLARQDAGVDSATAYLEFHPKYLGHAHHDPLNLVLFDHGQELLPDIGYSHTNYRMWTRSQMAHNTVVVDSADMPVPDSVHHGGSISAMLLGEDLQIGAATMAAYDQTSTYAREVLAITVPGQSRSYYVDVFRVAGGERHEYTFNGDANAEATATADVVMSDYGDFLLPPGVSVTPPQNETDTGDAEGHYYGYLYVRDVRRAETDDGMVAVDITTASSFPEEPHGARLIAHLATSEGDELFLGRAQSLRATRLEGRASDTNDVAESAPGVPRYTMPKVVLRRERGVRRVPRRGERPEIPQLVSQFRTVFEPVPAGEDPAIADIEVIDVTDGPDNAVALRIRFLSGKTHLVLSNPDGGPMTAEGHILDGRYGVVETDDAGVSLLWLGDGASITSGDTTLESDRRFEGVLSATLRRAQGDDRNALIVSGTVDPWVVGNYALVTHPDGSRHAYRITDVAVDQAQSVLDLGIQEPGLVGTADTGFALSSFPHTRWEGQHRVNIATVDRWRRP